MPLFLGDRRYDKNEKYPFACPFCDSSHANARLIQEHMKKNHAEDLERYSTEAKAAIAVEEDTNPIAPTLSNT